jgi:hypothetical protein
MKKEELDELRYRIRQVDHDLEETRELHPEFIIAQEAYDFNENDALDYKLIEAFRRGKSKEAAWLMQNQIMKWLRRINDGRNI